MYLSIGERGRVHIRASEVIIKSSISVFGVQGDFSVSLPQVGHLSSVSPPLKLEHPMFDDRSHGSPLFHPEIVREGLKHY